MFESLRRAPEVIFWLGVLLAYLAVIALVIVGTVIGLFYAFTYVSSLFPLLIK